MTVLQFSYYNEFYNNRVSLHSLYGGAFLLYNFRLDKIENTLPNVVKFLFINLLSVSRS
jgi:hypothetical protein